MKIYLVGGAVRDKMLGLPVKERDFVVVGATTSDMLKAGYKKVGKEFPVFLHPKTKEEYALARMEQKTGPGYTGFSFDTSQSVTLEEDLIRRDLTINAMAEDERGQLTDPYHGKADLSAKILRHVSSAFAEDPVRILRIARFLARYYHLGFHIADETISLMQSMVKKGEVDALVAERVWKEWERSLGEKNPEQFFIVLDQAHALPILFKEINLQSKGMQALREAAAHHHENIVRFAALLYDQSVENINHLCQLYRAPNEYRDLAKNAALHYQTLLKKNLTPLEFVNATVSIDIYRRLPRFLLLLEALKVIAIVEHVSFDSDRLLQCATNLRLVSNEYAKALAMNGVAHTEIPEKLLEKRLEFVGGYLNGTT